MPRPPAFETAAASSAVATGSPVPATGPMPAETTGYSIPIRSQNAVRNVGRDIFTLRLGLRATASEPATIGHARYRTALHVWGPLVRVAGGSGSSNVRCSTDEANGPRRS